LGWLRICLCQRHGRQYAGCRQRHDQMAQVNRGWPQGTRL